METDTDGDWEVTDAPGGAKIRVLVNPSPSWLTKRAASVAANPVPKAVDRIKTLTDALKAKGIDVGNI